MSKNLRLRDERELQNLLARSKAKLSGAAAPAVSAGAGSSRRRSNKFSATRTQHDGISFDSKHEGERYLLLREELKLGNIRNLRCHVPFALEVNGHHVTTLELDFVYERRILTEERSGFNLSWSTRYEDAKGYKRGAAFELFKLKAQLLFALRQITVEIV